MTAVASPERPDQLLPRWVRRARRAGVALAGGALVAVGTALLVLPGPGVAVIAAGLALLATEYQAPRRALDRIRRLHAARTKEPTPMHTPTTASAQTAPDPRRWWALLVLCTSLVLIALDNTILNVALPTLVRDLGASSSQLQWIVDSYVLVFAGLLLTMGALGDKYGRRGALSVGLVVFGTASALSAMADSPGQLIAARGLMGVGGALIMPATLSIITNIFPKEERGRAIAAWAAVSALGIAFGPMLGGWLLEHYWWGSVFLINVPIVILGLIGGRLLVPTSRDPEAPPTDVPGALLSITGLSALVFAIIEAPVEGWTGGPVVAAGLAAIVLLGGFVWWQRRTEHPMLDLQFFRNPSFSASSLAITMVFFGLFGSMFTLTQYLQFVIGYDALEAGTRVMPLALAMAFTAPLSAKLAERFGVRVVVTAGLTIVATGLWLFSLLGADASYGAIALRLVLLGHGMGLAMAPATEAIMNSLPEAKAGVGSAVNDTTRQVGGALGVAVLGSVLASGFADAMGPVTGQLPPEAAEAATDSIGGALAVASQVAGPVGAEIAAVARTGFTDAMGTTMTVGGLVALLGAAIALRWLPRHTSQPSAGDQQSEPEEILVG